MKPNQNQPAIPGDSSLPTTATDAMRWRDGLMEGCFEAAPQSPEGPGAPPPTVAMGEPPISPPFDVGLVPPDRAHRPPALDEETGGQAESPWTRDNAAGAPPEAPAEDAANEEETVEV